MQIRHGNTWLTSELCCGNIVTCTESFDFSQTSTFARMAVGNGLPA